MPPNVVRIGRAFATGAALLAPVLPGCIDGAARGEGEIDRQRGVEQAMITVSVTTEHPVYGVGEPVRLTLEVTNDSTQAVSLDFSSGQRFDFAISDASGENVWQWSAGRSFIQMMGQETIEPGGALRYTAQFEGELAAGTYTVSGKLASLGRPLTGNATFSVR